MGGLRTKKFRQETKNLRLRLNLVGIWGQVSKDQNSLRIYEHMVRKMVLTVLTALCIFIMVGILTDTKLLQKVCDNFIYIFNANILNTSKTHLSYGSFQILIRSKA